MLKNADMPAMPTVMFTGLTKREMFAMAALQGMLAHSGDSRYLPETIASSAMAYADALLAEMDKKDERK